MFENGSLLNTHDRLDFNSPLAVVFDFLLNR